MPNKWANIKRLTMYARHNIAPMKAMEILNIQRKIKILEEEQLKFRSTFKKESPFWYKTEHPYEILDMV